MMQGLAGTSKRRTNSSGETSEQWIRSMLLAGGPSSLSRSSFAKSY